MLFANKIYSFRLFLLAIILISPISKALSASKNQTNAFICANDYQRLSQKCAASLPSLLGWVEDLNVKNLCGGYYLDPEIILKNPIPLPFDKTPVSITATKPALISEYGESKLRGNVTITQPGREVTANEVTIYRDATSGHIKTGTLVGNVHLREYGKLVIAKDGTWDYQNKTMTLDDATYRMVRPTQAGNIYGWGKAKKVLRDALGVLKLNKASYSTCTPNNMTWEIWGNKIDLNKNTGRGSVTNALFYVKNTPVFYVPYYTFPIDKRRKSGFLFPVLGYSGEDGIKIGTPYYFNLAPNYDATLTPNLITKRGVLGEGEFRYLTQSSKGSINAEFIPNDRVFAQFQKDALTQYANVTPKDFLTQLENASDNRAYLSLQNDTIFNSHWSSSLDINYVSDDYFLQDFKGSPDETDDDQLLNRGDVKYDSEHWNFLGRLQAFQTLHPINVAPFADDQYRRLPQLDLSGNYPDEKYGLDYKLNSEFVNFDLNHDNDLLTGKLMPIGGRLNIQPIVSDPMNWAGGYFTPGLQLPITDYDLRHNIIDIQNDQTNDITRVLPIITADAGLFFSRALSLFNGNYSQTLEPRMYYLFVPVHNQNDIPLFDTTLNSFTYDQLFQNNRFSGIDRIGDANQVSLALTTRFLDGYTAEEKFNASIGQEYLFHRHDVCLPNSAGIIDCSSDPLANNNISPLVGQLQYNFTPKWSATANIAYDVSAHQTNNGAVNLTYQNGVNRIATIGYNYVWQGEPNTDGTPANLSRVNFGFAVPIKERWNVVGDWYYNLSHEHSISYFYGIEYESCCWAVRLVQNQNYIGTDPGPNQSNNFKRSIYLQFLLKGLGSVGNSDAGSLLTSQIPGYRDNFALGPKI